MKTAEAAKCRQANLIHNKQNADEHRLSGYSLITNNFSIRDDQPDPCSLNPAPCALSLAQFHWFNKFSIIEMNSSA